MSDGSASGLLVGRSDQDGPVVGYDAKRVLMERRDA
jgi:hypothetical protein